MEKAKPNHHGVGLSKWKHDDKEKAFSEAWAKFDKKHPVNSLEFEIDIFAAGFISAWDLFFPNSKRIRRVFKRTTKK